MLPMQREDSIADSVIAFLRRHPPFDRMAEEALAGLAADARVAYYADGQAIVSPDGGIADTFHVLHRGRVSVEPSDANRFSGDPGLVLGPGEIFPVSALVARRATTSTYRATGDVFCFLVPGDRFRDLLQRSPALQEFCTRQLAALLSNAQGLLQQQAGQASIEEQTLSESIGKLLQRAPVSCTAETSIADVLVRMRDERIGSMVIVAAATRPIGIFTERDALARVAAAQIDTRLPISQVMTAAPHVLSPEANAGEAALLMTKHGIRHVVVEDAGKLRGIVSEQDLFTLQRVSLRRVSTNISAAASVEAVARAATDIRLLARNLMAQGVAAEQLTQLIAELNDRVTCRVIDLVLARHALGDLRFCWIALGSEGRIEQTFSTDQDNGIILEAADGETAAAARARLLPFAREVNEGLDACGFPLCKGDIMAGNPAWCLSLTEWKSEFSAWIRNPAPQALLNAAIFFDFRPLWGANVLAAQLREWLHAQVRDNRRFLHQMAQNALTTQPPLGLLQDFVTSGSGRDAHTLDLKAQGARLFVDAARIYALQTGVSATGTAARLRESSLALGVNRDEVAAVLDAFFHIQQLRLRHDVLDTGTDAPSANRIRPDRQNSLERRILKEALLLARRVQKRLALDYQA